MNLYIPKAARDYDDWADSDLVFLNFMVSLTGRDNATTIYHFHTEDFYRLLGLDGNCILYEHPSIDRVRRLFRIGFLNDNTISVQYKPELYKAQNGGRRMPNQISKVHGKIWDEKALRTYFYVMGRTAAGNYLEDNPEGTTYKEKVESVIPYAYVWKAI